MREYSIPKKQQENWTEIDVWAETIGKNIYVRPLSTHNQVLSTKDYDRIWKRLWKEEKNKPIHIQENKMLVPLVFNLSNEKENRAFVQLINNIQTYDLPAEIVQGKEDRIYVNFEITYTCS